MSATKTKYTRVPLVGLVGTMTRAYEPDSMDGELTIETVATRSTWASSAEPALIDRVVGILRRVYDECRPASEAWSRDLLSARDHVLTLEGDALMPAIRERERIGNDEWRRRVFDVIRAALDAAGWQFGDGAWSGIAQLSLGGDRGSGGIGTTAGGNILAADEPGQDVGYRGSLMSVIWRSL